ncbi:hypothetical protein ABN764_03150 [Paenibacillaceae sp. P-4]|uniref:Uncharacterized protein n=1 Tax=Paenibacillus suaedae TaxID=3077233 RepID=A0AAJ2JUQ8_9BACL|nr:MULTISPECIES: hypothetical protein [unclassified Paenibacillus]MDT8977455.1 hypothetical protein [Paenibacillus sp. chi10]GAV14673.1 hypothetical protein PBN151_4651 [Paenibacillus sp. NAIST15-1]
MRKQDEMERYHNDKSAKNGYMFYTIALLLWGLYDFTVKGNSGLQFTILLIGNAIFLWTRVYYKRKVM